MNSMNIEFYYSSMHKTLYLEVKPTFTWNFFI